MTPDSALPSPIWVVFGWPLGLALLTIAAMIMLRRGRRLLILLALLFIGIGEFVFMAYASAWRHQWSCTAWVICFLVMVLFLLRGMGRQEFSGLFAGQNSLNRTLLFLLFAAWIFIFYSYLGDSSIPGLPGEQEAARSYDADASCAASILRRVARQTPALAQFAGGKDTQNSTCLVQWMKIVQRYWATRSGPPCLEMVDGDQRHHYYCVISFWDLNWWERQYLNPGDMVVAQTSLGKASAFLRPRRAFVDYIFYPRGKYIETADNPDNWFREHVWRSFWAVFWFLFAGAFILINIIR